MLKTVYRRYYPMAGMTASLIGLTRKIPDPRLATKTFQPKKMVYLHSDIERGDFGLERSFDRRLRNYHGIRLMASDGRGLPYDQIITYVSPVEGNRLALTIQSDIQYYTYQAVKRAVLRHKAKYGCAIVLAKNGDILAVVQYPSNDPNVRTKFNAEYYRNRVFADAIEVGSTIKPFIALLAFDKKLTYPKEVLDVSADYKNIKADSKHEQLDVKQIIQYSNNVGIAQIADRLNKADMWNMFNNLGFGQPLNVVPDIEHDGILKHYRKWQESDKLAVSYGYGPMNITMAQLARAYLTLINDGRYIDLRLIKSTQNPKRRRLALFGRKALVQTIDILDKTVSDAGSGKHAQLLGYAAAGKTGTTHVFRPNYGYDRNAYNAFFVGFAPIKDSQYVMAIHINEPKRYGRFGGDVAAPVFREAMQNILRLK